MTSFSDPMGYFAHAPSAAADLHVFEVWAFQTPDEVQAHLTGELDVFSDLEDWLDDFPGQFFGRRGTGLFHVACADDVDAVLFKLRWGDHIGQEWLPRCPGRLS